MTMFEVTQKNFSNLMQEISLALSTRGGNEDLRAYLSNKLKWDADKIESVVAFFELDN